MKYIDLSKKDSNNPKESSGSGSSSDEFDSEMKLKYQNLRMSK